jgi:hypothetical protein
MIDVFNKSRFEGALPVHQSTGQPLWQGLGLRDGEECYIVPVRPGVLIYIRSSVQQSGWAAEAAEDSIRCWLASDITGRPLSSKPQRWITRVNGWERRLTKQLQLFWRLGMQLEACPQPVHTDDQTVTMMHARLIKKDGPNKGKWFPVCPECGHWDWDNQLITE